MYDKGYSNGGLVLCTDFFKVHEVVMLMNMLRIRYQFKCTLQNANGLPRIYISRTFMAKLRALVKPHMLPSITYKLYGTKVS